ncbi:nitroreductase [Bacillus sp. UMB0899]|uniref:nitroreductase family protein n=1 Tax=Metabacillus schmidteae TaxID=2730405 RepID=UPI000C810004|nr:nitroreductase family protein [Metabacillus schmidteae]PMC40477.1 nitroreductase [Bacillus sp. UMB0899]
MNTLEIIHSRRTIKSFKSDSISQEQLNKWLQAGTMAPNHKMTEPWEVLVVGKETRGKINHKADFFGAPVVLAVLSKHGATEIETYENLITTACFVQNFNLAAWEDGAGTFWSSVGNAQKNREILGVSDDYNVVGVLGVGYPEEINAPKDRAPIQEKIKYLP